VECGKSCGSLGTQLGVQARRSAAAAARLPIQSQPNPGQGKASQRACKRELLAAHDPQLPTPLPSYCVAVRPLHDRKLPAERAVGETREALGMSRRPAQYSSIAKDDDSASSSAGLKRHCLPHGTELQPASLPTKHQPSSRVRWPARHTAPTAAAQLVFSFLLSKLPRPLSTHLSFGILLLHAANGWLRRCFLVTHHPSRQCVLQTPASHRCIFSVSLACDLPPRQVEC